MQRLVAAYAASVVLLACAGAARAGTYVFQDIAVPGATGTEPMGIDSAHRVVGYYTDSAGVHGFIFAKGVYTTVDDSGSENYFGFNAVSPNGIATGFYIPSGSTSPDTVGFTYDIATSQLSVLTIPVAGAVMPRAANRSGVVVGFVSLDDSHKFQSFRASIKRTIILRQPPDGTRVIGNSINDAGVVAGCYSGGGKDGPTHGFTLKSGTYTTIDPPNASSTCVDSIRDDGAVVGSYVDSSKPQGDPLYDPVFVDIAGQIQIIPVPGSINTYPMVLTPRGQVVGGFEDTNFNSEAFIWQNGVVSSANVPGSTSTTVAAANQYGEFVGLYAKDHPNVGSAYVAFCNAPPCTK